MPSSLMRPNCIAAALLLSGVFTAGYVHAAPINIPDLPGVTIEITTSTVQHLDFVISGGGFTEDATMDPNLTLIVGTQFWEITILSLQLEEVNGSNDFVNITGEVFHKPGLTPDILHLPAGATIGFEARLKHNGLNEYMKLDGGNQLSLPEGSLYEKDKPHDTHTDEYAFLLDDEASSGNSHFASWSLLGHGLHVPEPGTLSLLAFGGLILARRRR